MNEQLSKALADVLVVVKDGALFAAAQAKNELPVLVEEYLRWGVADAALGLFFWVLASVGLYKVGRYLRTREDWHGDEAEMLGRFAGFVVVPLGQAGACISVFASASTMVQILIAPRVYLLERLSDLVK